MIVSISEAKRRLGHLLECAAAGQDVVIARRGKPVARLAALEKPASHIRFGVLGRKLWVADDFDAPLPEHLTAAFEGR